MLRLKSFAVGLIISALLFFFVAKTNKGTSILLNHLIVDKQTNSELLIIESWLSPEHLDKISDIFFTQGYSTALISGADEIPPMYLSSNGFIIIKNLTNQRELLTIHSLLKGSKAKNEYAKCKVLKNDSLITEVECIKKIMLSFNCSLSPNDSLVFNFYNDAYDHVGDRNFELLTLDINGSGGALSNFDIWYLTRGNYEKASFNSISERLAYQLSEKGVPSDSIVYLNCDMNSISRTYSYAQSNIEWMKQNGYTSADIITLSFHSRRTLLSHKKAGKEFNFGSIPLEHETSKSRLIKEFIGNPLLRITPRFILEWNIKKTSD